MVTDMPDAVRGSNFDIARRLRDYAELLALQGDDGFRPRAYRNAADEVEHLTRPLDILYHDGGIGALTGLRGIGRGIAAAIAEMLTTGRWQQYDRLKGNVTPEVLFRTLPGVGPVLARRLVDELDVETLEELETELRLGEKQVEGLGTRRRQAILDSLDNRLARIRRTTGIDTALQEPEVSLLLDIDALFRKRAAAGELRLIAPRRFNPTGEAWLPVMHSRKGPWHLTALFSNTARAHELHRTRDWVVIYFHLTDGPEGRRTVVTERQGDLAGRRVVRGREEECAALAHDPKAP